MEPLAALGLVGNIITLIDFSSKLINAASSARHSASGLPGDLQDAAVITKNLESFLTQLPAPTLPPTASAADKALAELTANCRSTCDQLNELVKKIKGKGSGSRRDSLRVAAKGLWHKDTLQELEERLDSHRSQIMDHFHRIFQEEQTAKLRTLVDSQAGMAGKVAEEMEKQLKQTKEQIARMMESVQASSASVTNKFLRDICDRLSELSTRTKTMNAEQEVLNLLRFPELRTRKNAVENAHDGTYRWILYDPELELASGSESDFESDPESSPESESARTDRLSYASFDSDSTDSAGSREAEEHRIWRERFVNWLKAEEGQGSFFISGKPGSGKSTLMKFISRDAHTRQLLHDWATQHGKQLLLLSFYFWISGTQLQKSIEGLYRSILWKILRQAPKLIETTFPTLFQKASAGSLHESDLDPSHLPNMFQRILHSADLLRRYRVCLFIDGLDEYDGDHWMLAKNLKSWCSTPAIKLCVSSRPRPEFIAIFGRPGPWLELHELTRGDIRRVVQDQFAADERVTERQQHSSEFDELTKSLVDRAKGVFIWVVLTMRSLLSGIGNHSSTIQLQKRLDAIPTELNAMFRYIFDGIEKPDREAAARLFLIMNLQLHTTIHFFADLTFRRLNSSVYIHSLLDEVYDNPAYEKSLMEGTLGPPIRLEEWEARCLAMNHRLTGRCRGLIVVRSLNRATRVTDEIQFVHRTVRDFLSQSEIRDIIQDAAGDFDPFRALSLSLLATLKHTPESTKEVTLVRAEDAVDTLLNLWSSGELSGCGSFFKEFEPMTSMFTKLNTKLNPDGKRLWFLPTHAHIWMKSIEPMTPGKVETMIIVAGIHAGAFSTALERLKVSRPELLWALIAASVRRCWDYSGPRLADLSSIIDLLLEMEDLLNKDLTGFCTYRLPPTFNSPCVPLLAEVSSVLQTPWKLLLQEAAFFMFRVKYRKHAPPELEYSLQRLLKQGADPNVRFIGYEVLENQVSGLSGKVREGKYLLRGPLSMDLPTTLRSWGFNTSCGEQVGSTKGHGSETLPICTEREETLLESSLMTKLDSRAGFIVVSVIAGDQIENLPTWEAKVNDRDIHNFYVFLHSLPKAGENKHRWWVN